jgi:hypothetical protein
MLHIHNGESTAATLRHFGFPGDHYAFKEVLMCGPTPAGLSPDDWFSLRAKFLADEYELELQDARRDFHKQEQTLDSIPEQDEVVLWFEHDLFCQINLIYLLDRISPCPSDATRLSLICIGEFPGIDDFRGLGQLTGEQLASLFDSRHEISESESKTAARAWSAYCSSDPRAITNLLNKGTSSMPFLQQALLLHLARFPSVRNGLGRIENRALELISHGAIDFKSLFPLFAKSEPVYGLGDSQFWSELKRLSDSGNPIINVSGFDDKSDAFDSNQFCQARLELTETGRAVLAGEQDFLELNRIDYWLGGVHLSHESLWRWDELRGTIDRDAGI